MTDDEAKKMILKRLLAGPASALQMIDHGIDCGRGGFAIYPLLRDLAASRMVSTREEAGGPKRGFRVSIVYALTDTGRLAALGTEK